MHFIFVLLQKDNNIWGRWLGGGSWGNLDKWRRIGLRTGGKKEKMRRNIGRDGKEYEKEMNHKKKRR